MNIRNFCIIAHIDHGKSTLADRLLESTGTLTSREMSDQVLDNMDLERERGITIKARAVRLTYTHDGQDYILNLIDTPGHVDFNYEVSRSLAACEGAILVVDAAQGIEAQTLANTYLAMDANLEIIPIVNKIDLVSAEPERVRHEIEEILGIEAADCPLVSAKEGVGIDDVLRDVLAKIPAPTGDRDAPLKALIFDSFYDPYKGVVLLCRIMEGHVGVDDAIRFMQTDKRYDVVEVGYLHPYGTAPCDGLSAGEVGYITASIKTLSDVAIGDTITTVEGGTAEPLPGYRGVHPMVYCGIYPSDGARYDDMRDALTKLQLNDAALIFEPETSVALGYGFRCGFLGLLHMEVIQQRIEREFNLDIITTAPSVVYKIIRSNGDEGFIDNPTNMPDPTLIHHMEEPIAKAEIFTPTEYVGGIMDLCNERRGVFKDMKYLDTTRVLLQYELPLNEIIYDFFDTLKSRSRGFASFDYEVSHYAQAPLVKLDIMLNGEVVDAFSLIVHADKAYARGRRMAEKLKEALPRQMFEIPIQACIGGKVIARETVRAMRKDVLAKCYGGDITRKKKLLEKQKEGKKKMRSLGTVEVPTSAFIEVLKL